MIVKDIVYEDLCNYKCPSMFIIFPYCSFKCDTENGNKICQNSTLVTQPNYDLKITYIVDRYMKNNITHAIVCGGLEPLDSWSELKDFISCVRNNTHDDIVIYTGYNKEEISDKIEWLSNYENIIVKFGRYIPNQTPHYEEILGVMLASDNQYAERLDK